MKSDIYILLAFFTTGLLIGVLFDIFRVLRKNIKTPNILIYIEDILFWILAGIMVLYTIFTFTTGEIRLYMIIMLITRSV
ncbi:MAG: spore cortex biosynthesis protein YabQ [Clostridia bacterium]|nr:spore cortex biosynthesis protein YabQ [Clostridia bacterium]